MNDEEELIYLALKFLQKNKGTPKTLEEVVNSISEGIDHKYFGNSIGVKMVKQSGFANCTFSSGGNITNSGWEILERGEKFIVEYEIKNNIVDYRTIISSCFINEPFIDSYIEGQFLQYSSIGVDFFISILKNSSTFPFKGLNGDIVKEKIASHCLKRIKDFANKKTPNQKLDDILMIFKTSNKSVLEAHDFKSLYLGSELEGALQKLENEGMIDSFIDGQSHVNYIFGAKYYSITFDGRNFEGYENKSKKTESEMGNDQLEEVLKYEILDYLNSKPQDLTKDFLENERSKNYKGTPLFQRVLEKILAEYSYNENGFIKINHLGEKAFGLIATKKKESEKNEVVVPVNITNHFHNKGEAKMNYANRDNYDSSSSKKVKNIDHSELENGR